MGTAGKDGGQTAAALNYVDTVAEMSEQ